MGARPGGGDGVLCVYCTPDSRMLLRVAWVAGCSISWEEKPENSEGMSH